MWSRNDGIGRGSSSASTEVLKRGRQGGRGGSGKRFFGRGDVKYAFLDLLSRKPMHGYQIMKALRDQSGGLYSPSPGSIYPTLQILEEKGWAASMDNKGRKVYYISEEGRAAVLDWKRERFQLKEAHKPNEKPIEKGGEEGAMWSAAKDLARLMMEMQRNHQLQPEQMAALTQLYRSTWREIWAIAGSTELMD